MAISHPSHSCDLKILIQICLFIILRPTLVSVTYKNVMLFINKKNKKSKFC